MGEWQEVALGDLLEVKHGFAFKGKYFDEAGSDVLLTPRNFEPSGGLDLSDGRCKRYSGPVGRDFVLKQGDVVVAMTDLKQTAPILGAAGVIPGDGTYLHNQRIGKVLVRDADRIHPSFVPRLLNSPVVREHVRATATGATVRHTAPKRICSIKVPIPTIGTQRRIAAVLSAFDELIEINKRRIELLEDLARSLYREWFVHFRFPGHEDVELVDSELGPIPAGCEVCPIADIATLARGRSYRRAELSEVDGVPFLTLKCVNRGGGFRWSGVKRYVGRYRDAQTATAGDVVVAVTDMAQERRIVGQSFRMPDLGEPFAVPSLDLALLKSIDPQKRLFLYASLRYSGFSDAVRMFANGANVLHLAVERIVEYPIVVPRPELVEEFTRAVAAALDGAEFLEAQNRQLTTTRDLLLPRLVTGRLDISDIDLGALEPAEVE